MNPLIPAAPIAPALGTSIAMPGPVPSMGSPVLPSVSLETPSFAPGPVPSLGAGVLPRVSQTPPPTQTQLDITKRDDAINKGSGIDQIQNPLLRGIARAADIAGSVFTPNLARYIPGTTLHHNDKVNEFSNNVAKDQAEEQATAQTANEAATTAHTNAATAHTQAETTGLPTEQADKHLVSQAQVGNLESETNARDTPKPKSPEQQVYDEQIAQGKTPTEAFTAVNRAKNTKDATFQQQFLDAYKKAHPGISDTDAISATIRATSTEPKIQVINAGAADRAAAKNAGLDTSDPAMQASINAVANGSLKLADVFGRGATTAQKAQFAAAVKAVNPNYNSGDHDIENKVRQYMTSGQGGATLSAGTTLNHHLDLYDKAVDAVHNGDNKTLNTIGNSMQIQMGNDAQTNLALIRQGVAMEAARFWTGGVPGEAEINQFNQNLSGDGSPKQMHGGANTVRFMAKGKLEGLRGQSEAGATGQPNFAGASGGDSGMGVNLKSAMALPQNKGKSEDEVVEDIQSHGHTVIR